MLYHILKKQTKKPKPHNTDIIHSYIKARACAAFSSSKDRKGEFVLEPHSVGQKLRSVSEMSETSSTVAQGFTFAGSGHQNWLSDVHGAWDTTVLHSTRAGHRISCFPNLWHCFWHYWEVLLQPAGRFFCCKHSSLLLLHLIRNLNSKEVTDIRREGKPLDIRHLLGLRYQMKWRQQHAIQRHEALQYTSVLNPKERRQKSQESPPAKPCAHWRTTFSSSKLPFPYSPSIEAYLFTLHHQAFLNISLSFK